MQHHGRSGYLLSAALAVTLALPARADCVIVLHGLARTASAMEMLAAAFKAAGYRVANVDYPSREHPIETLAPLAIEQGLTACAGEHPVHFVTHSLGGILVRQYLHEYELKTLGRVVMLAPPNQGSEVVDALRNVPGFAWFNGPAGLQLGTDADSLPRRLPAVDFELGVIAGTRTFNVLLSQWLPNPDDGKVSVESTKVEGMRDFAMVPYSHPFIMQREPVIALALRFIATGHFAEAPTTAR